MRKHLKFSNVIAVVALFAVLGGGAYAASLGKNTVGSKQLKANAVKTKKIADAAVTTPKIADNAVNGAKADESSFSQVPSAAQADTAGHATTATDATNANHATTASEASNAEELGGFDLENVRPSSRTTSNGTHVDLDGNPATVLSRTTFQLASGGASLAVMGSVNIDNPSAVDRPVECAIILGDDIEQIGQTAQATVPAISTAQLPVVGQRTHLQADGGVLVSIKCSDESGGALLDYDSGDLIVQAFPDD